MYAYEYSEMLMESGSVIGIATTLRAGRPGVRIPVRARHSAVLQNVKTGSGAHPT